MKTRPVRETVRAIRDEYLELPGLRLTPQQVQRLYSLDGVTCEAVLGALVDVQFLVRSPDGRYVRRLANKMCGTVHRQPRFAAA